MDGAIPPSPKSISDLLPYSCMGRSSVTGIESRVAASSVSRRRHERADDFPKRAQVETREIVVDGWSVRQRRRDAVRVDLDFGRHAAPMSRRLVLAPERSTAFGNTSMKARIIDRMIAFGHAEYGQPLTDHTRRGVKRERALA